MSDLYSDPVGMAVTAAAELARLTGKEKHDVALVMGSGWISAADALGTPTHEFSITDLPGLLRFQGRFPNNIIQLYVL